MVQLQERTAPKIVVSEQKKIIKSSTEKGVVFKTTNFDLWYGEHHALKNINIDILEN